MEGSAPRATPSVTPYGRLTIRPRVEHPRPVLPARSCAVHNTGDAVRSVDNVSRPLLAAPVTTVSAGDWTLLFSSDPGMSELFHLPTDPTQQKNVIGDNLETAWEMHGMLLSFMRETNVAEALIKSRAELRM